MTKKGNSLMIWIKIESKIMKLLYIHFQRVKKRKAVKQSANIIISIKMVILTATSTIMNTIMITKIISIKKDTKLDNTATINIV